MAQFIRFVTMVACICSSGAMAETTLSSLVQGATDKTTQQLLSSTSASATTKSGYSSTYTSTSSTTSAASSTSPLTASGSASSAFGGGNTTATAWTTAYNSESVQPVGSGPNGGVPLDATTHVAPAAVAAPAPPSSAADGHVEFGSPSPNKREMESIQRALDMLRDKRSADFGWENDTHMVILAKELSGARDPVEDDNHVQRIQELEDTLSVKQMEIEILSMLDKHHVLPRPVNPDKLARYVLALGSLCKDPKRFYGHDLVAALQHHEPTQVFNPSILYNSNSNNNMNSNNNNNNQNNNNNNNNNHHQITNNNNNNNNNKTQPPNEHHVGQLNNNNQPQQQPQQNLQQVQPNQQQQQQQQQQQPQQANNGNNGQHQQPQQQQQQPHQPQQQSSYQPQPPMSNDRNVLSSSQLAVSELQDQEFALTTLAVCSSAAHVRKRQIRRLLDIASGVTDQSVDTIAMVILALRCIVTDHRHRHLQHFVRRPARGLATLQDLRGNFGSLRSTALAMQALQDLEPDPAGAWNRSAASEWILERQRSDGGWYEEPIHDGQEPNVGIGLTADIILALGWKGLGAVRALQCDHVIGETSENASENGESKLAAPVGLATSAEESEPRNISYTYTLWLGSNVTEAFTLSLISAKNTSFFRAMTQAADLDPRFGFEAREWPNGHYVHTLAGKKEEPRGYNYWLLYRLPEMPDKNSPPGNQLIAPVGVDELMVEEGEHYLYWYKKL